MIAGKLHTKVIYGFNSLETFNKLSNTIDKKVFDTLKEISLKYKLLTNQKSDMDNFKLQENYDIKNFKFPYNYKHNIAT